MSDVELVEITHAEWEAWEAEMAQDLGGTPDLPTEAELDAMFAVLGETDPFRG